MFLIEGLATVAIGFYIWRRLPGRPSDATWLTAEEAGVLEERAAAQDAPDHASLRGNWKTAFGRPFILLLALVYFVNQVTSVAIQYNFPSIVEDLDVNGSFLIGVVSGSIGIGAFIGVLVMPWLHARMQDETRMILVCTIATAVVATAYAFVDGAVARVLLIVLAMLFLVGVLPLYWSVAMARMSGLMAAAGLAFINTVGLLGGFVGPYLYGFAEDAIDAAAGFAVLIGFAVAGIFLIPLLRRAVRAEDRRTTEPAAEGVRSPSANAGAERP
jgi:sugar phosphate permease